MKAAGVYLYIYRRTGCRSAAAPLAVCSLHVARTPTTPADAVRLPAHHITADLPLGFTDGPSRRFGNAGQVDRQLFYAD